jgi:hypothetical protein
MLEIGRNLKNFYQYKIMLGCFKELKGFSNQRLNERSKVITIRESMIENPKLTQPILAMR